MRLRVRAHPDWRCADDGVERGEVPLEDVEVQQQLLGQAGGVGQVRPAAHPPGDAHHVLQADQGCDLDFCRADWTG